MNYREHTDSVKRTSVDKMEQLMPLIQERLDAGQSVRFYPRGVSMLPMLRQDVDSVRIEPVSGPLRKYDLPLYRRDNGKYVLHRIVKTGETFTCMGDNQYLPEPNIRQDQIIAVVTAFYRGERMIPVTHPGYRLYCRLWHISRPLRRFWTRGMGWLRRQLK